MSAMACELVVGTGDGKMKLLDKSEGGAASKIIAKDIVLEIIDNAMDVVDDQGMQKIGTEEVIKGKHGLKEKTTVALIGTGDQKSVADLEHQEPLMCHPPVEKKNRLTDLVKNSKQILAKIMSDSKMRLQDEKKEDEKIMEVIELDCVQISDLPFKSRSKLLEPALSTNHTPTTSKATNMQDMGTSPIQQTCTTPDKKRMTFPRMSGSKAKAVFAAKCRTLKKEATNLKKKKWDMGIVNLFKKKRESGEKSKIAEEPVKKVD